MPACALHINTVITNSTAEGIVNPMIARPTKSCASSSPCQSNPFVRSRLLEWPIVKLALELWMNFHILFPLGDHLNDLCIIAFYR
jgi:hypothetical protein